jgi:hypothetical protein
MPVNRRKNEHAKEVYVSNKEKLARCLREKFFIGENGVDLMPATTTSNSLN